MSLIKAFRGLRPAKGRAAEVAAPPYDVMSTAEARQMVEGRPWSFLHISRPEVDLPVATDPYAPEVYAKAAENLQHQIDQGVLQRDPAPCYYIYRLTMGQHQQTGLVAAVSVAAYEADRIKKHEFTRPAKEDDRVRQINALNAQTGPVFLVYPAQADVDAILKQGSSDQPEVDITAADGVRHELWAIRDTSIQKQLTDAFEAMPALYVADGHHRSAAACRVTGERRAARPDASGDEPWNYFLSVIFPHDQMQILDYNRLVRDLNGHEPAAFLKKLEESFEVTRVDAAYKPDRPASFGLYLDKNWYRLVLKPELIPQDDPVARLDVSLLGRFLIEPILGISDPRRDERIDFVGGIRGLDGITARVDSGEMRLGLSLFPCSMNDLMAVADVGEVMPPKSTWFEPKLADGLVSHVLDNTWD